MSPRKKLIPKPSRRSINPGLLRVPGTSTSSPVPQGVFVSSPIQPPPASSCLHEPFTPSLLAPPDLIPTPTNAAGGDEDIIDEQMDWMSSRLRSLIEAGKQALGKEIVVQDDSIPPYNIDDVRDGFVDDGSRDWQDDVHENGWEGSGWKGRGLRGSTSRASLASTSRRERARTTFEPSYSTSSDQFLTPSHTPTRMTASSSLSSSFQHHRSESVPFSNPSSGRPLSFAQSRGYSDDINGVFGGGGSPDLSAFMEEARRIKFAERYGMSGR